jgi:two-component system response regulator DegU
LAIAVTTKENPSPGGAAAPGKSRRRARGRNDKIQLLIVDEHALQRAGVKTLLEHEADVEVVAEADTIAHAIDAVRDGDVNVVLMDVDEATSESVEDMRRLRDELPEDGALVVLARNEDDEGVYRAVVGGAAGHVGENAQPEELVETIKQAAHGEEPISRTLAERPEVGRRVLETYAELSANNNGRHPHQLSERELNILSLAAQGQTNQQIGKHLGVSEHTVKSSISLILARLGLRHRTEAVVHALRNGWITMPSMNENPAVGDADGRFIRPEF